MDEWAHTLTMATDPRHIPDGSRDFYACSRNISGSESQVFSVDGGLAASGGANGDPNSSDHMVREGRSTMKRFLEYVINVTDNVKFWVAVFVVSLSIVFAYAFVVNRDAVTRNSDTIAKQQEQLVELCHTIKTIDVILVQISGSAARALGSGDLPDWARSYFLYNNAVFDTAHQELNESRPCKQVE